MAIDITAVKPASQPGNPSWATNGGTRVAPTLGQKQTGFTDRQRPAFNIFNWILGFLADWAKWGEDAADELDAAKLSRKGASASTPQGMIGTLSSERDGVDDCGAIATRWATMWTYVLNIATNIFLSATATLSATRLSLDATADVKTTARVASVTSRSMPKLWATFTTNGVGGVTIQDGFNVGVPSIVNVAGTNVVRIPFAAGAAMATGTYAVMVANNDGSGTTTTVIVNSKIAASFDLTFWDSTFLNVNPAARAVKADVVVFGVQ